MPQMQTDHTWLLDLFSVQVNQVKQIIHFHLYRAILSVFPILADLFNLMLRLIHNDVSFACVLSMRQGSDSVPSYFRSR